MVDTDRQSREARVIPDPRLRKYPLKHEDFETVKQTESADCGAAVAAMVVAMPLERVKEAMVSTQMELKGDLHYYYKTCEMARYLACHGILMGMHARGENDEALTLRPSEYIEFKWYVRDFPAILAVKSERYEGQDHWVLWDGKRVRDPSPLKPDLCKLPDYRVLDIYPLVHIQD
jgi:hypothetical protein